MLLWVVAIRFVQYRATSSVGSPSHVFLILDLDNRGHLANFERLLCGGGCEQVHRAGDHASPSGLVARPKSSAVVAVEKLVKLDVLAPVRVLLELFFASIHRPATVLSFQ